MIAGDEHTVTFPCGFCGVLVILRCFGRRHETLLEVSTHEPDCPAAP